MDFKEFTKNVLNTENIDFRGMKDRLSLASTLRLLHGSVGVSTEGGELLDAMKKYIFYGKPIDRANVKEELGDALYYISLVMDEMGFTLEEVMETNSDKLKARYPEMFTEDKAINRDLDTERKILEK